jgi:acyl carrier protein
MIEVKVKQLLAMVLDIPEAELSNESSMDSVESWDSLSQMNFVICLEEEFEIVIPDSEIQNMISLKLVSLLIKELVDSPQS